MRLQIADERAPRVRAQLHEGPVHGHNRQHTGSLGRKESADGLDSKAPTGAGSLRVDLEGARPHAVVSRILLGSRIHQLPGRADRALPEGVHRKERCAEWALLYVDNASVQRWCWLCTGGGS